MRFLALAVAVLGLCGIGSAQAKDSDIQNLFDQVDAPKAAECGSVLTPLVAKLSAIETKRNTYNFTSSESDQLKKVSAEWQTFEASALADLPNADLIKDRKIAQNCVKGALAGSYGKTAYEVGADALRAAEAIDYELTYRDTQKRTDAAMQLRSDAANEGDQNYKGLENRYNNLVREYNELLTGAQDYVRRDVEMHRAQTVDWHLPEPQRPIHCVAFTMGSTTSWNCR